MIGDGNHDVGSYEGTKHFPDEAADRTWHVHSDNTWGWGVFCDECHTPRSYRNSRNPEPVAYGTSSISPNVDRFMSTGDPTGA
jgi:hypothetical protein